MPNRLPYSPDMPLEQGNIDPNTRPITWNPDGSYSTYNTITTNVNGTPVNYPGVSLNGDRRLSREEAFKQYLDTGKHFGKWASSDQAARQAELLHERGAEFYDPYVQKWGNLTRPNYPGWLQNQIQEGQEYYKAGDWGVPPQQTAPPLPPPALLPPQSDAPGDYYQWDPRAKYVAEMSKYIRENNAGGVENNGFRSADPKDPVANAKLAEWNKQIRKNGYGLYAAWCALTGKTANDAAQGNLSPAEYESFKSVLTGNSAKTLSLIKKNKDFTTTRNKIPEFDQSKPNYWTLSMTPDKTHEAGHQAAVQWDPYNKKFYYMGGNEEMYNAQGQKIPNPQAQGMRQQGINVLPFSYEDMPVNPHGSRPITWSQYKPPPPLVPVNGLANK